MEEEIGSEIYLFPRRGSGHGSVFPSLLVASHLRMALKPRRVEIVLVQTNDTLPLRFRDHPIPDGPAKETTINIDHFVDDYYDVKGWEK